MLVGTIYFTIKPTRLLIDRLNGASEYAQEVLGEPLLIPAKWGGVDIDEADFAAVKIVFIAYMNHGRDEVSSDIVPEVFGGLKETVEEFDRWWTCEVFEYETSLRDMLLRLRHTGNLKCLDPVVTHLGHFQTPIQLSDLPSEGKTAE